MESPTDVLVIGGGCAGLLCARKLAQAGKRVSLVEARNRLGGRVATHYAGAVPVELGAEFLHGKPPVLMELLRESGLPFYELAGRFYRMEEGELVCEPEGEPDDEGGDPFALLKHLPATAEEDVSFCQAVERMALPRWQAEWLTGYVEGFNAASAERISAASLVMQQLAEESMDGETSSYLSGGYSSLVEWLAGECLRLGVTIHCSQPVRKVLWKQGEVVAVCDVAEHHARQACITLPLGVLKQGSVQFEPRPSRFLDALDAVVMGDAARISLLFDHCFWQRQAPEMRFLLLRGEATENEGIGVWWSRFPSNQPLLTAWVGGPQSRSFASGEQLLEAALQSLARSFHTPMAELRSWLVSWHTHDWHADPYACGAYSYVAAGGLPGLAELCRPVEETLFFAGEHTEQDGHWGTVHAALGSGLRAAGQVLGTAW